MAERIKEGDSIVFIPHFGVSMHAGSGKCPLKCAVARSLANNAWSASFSIFTLIARGDHFPHDQP
jgi:hypothetical protein